MSSIPSMARVCLIMSCIDSDDKEQIIKKFNSCYHKDFNTKDIADEIKRIKDAESVTSCNSIEDLVNVSMAGGLDIFQLLVMQKKLDNTFHSRYERLLITEGDIKKLYHIIPDISEEKWSRMAGIFNRLYVDRMIPDFDFFQQLANKPAYKHIEKSPSQDKKVLAKRLYEEWKSGKRRFNNTAKYLLRKFGVLDKEYIHNEIKNIDNLVNKHFKDLKTYDGESKQIVRMNYINLALKNLGGAIKYLGLEGHNFASYALLNKYLAINPALSLIPERHEVEYNIMQSIVSHNAEIVGGQMFSGINLYNGSLEDCIIDNKYSGMRFNLVNLDFEGGWSGDKEIILDRLLSNEMLEDKALLIVTLNDASLERIRTQKFRGPKKGYNTRDQQKLLERVLYEKSSHYSVKKLYKQSYADRKTVMTTYCYLISK